VNWALAYQPSAVVTIGPIVKPSVQGDVQRDSVGYHPFNDKPAGDRVGPSEKRSPAGLSLNGAYFSHQED